MAGAEKSWKTWPFLLPRKWTVARDSRLCWRVGSSAIIPAVALMSKVWANWLNTFHIENHEVFLETVASHYRQQRYPLITISNHSSCLDDPILWGALFPWTWNLSSSRHRWISAAQDICFTEAWHSLFFSLGKTFPIIRGKGIHQPSMDFGIELLKDNQFLHVFPQGKVVEDNDYDQIKELAKLPLGEQLKRVSLRDTDLDKCYQLKWGLARLILDTLSGDSRAKSIQILPFYHQGMDNILPNVQPYIPQINKTVTLCVRPEGPIVFDDHFITNVCCGGDPSLGSKEKMSLIMEYIANELKILKVKTMILHEVKR